MFVINSLSLEQQKATEKITKYNLVPVTFDVCGFTSKSSSKANHQAMQLKKQCLINSNLISNH